MQVEGKTISTIGPGLLCLVGVGRDDSAEDAEYMCGSRLNSYNLQGLLNHYHMLYNTVLPVVKVRVSYVQLQESQQCEALAKFEGSRPCL